MGVVVAIPKKIAATHVAERVIIEASWETGFATMDSTA
jgi:hypothetical protein